MNTLLISGLSSAVVGLLYAYIGRRLSKRDVPQKAALAHSMFIVWWYALAGSSFLTAATIGAYQLERLPLWLYGTIVQAQLLAIMVGLWGLLYYLIYLYTGRRSAFTILGVAYFIGYLALVGLVGQAGTYTGLTNDGWSISAIPELEFGRGIGLFLVAALVGPQILACVGYLSLYPKATTNTQRWRIAWVAGSIIVWFGASVVASVLDSAESQFWQVSSKILSLAGGAAILLAYQPPRWVRDKYGIEAIEP